MHQQGLLKQRGRNVLLLLLLFQVLFLHSLLLFRSTHEAAKQIYPLQYLHIPPPPFVYSQRGGGGGIIVGRQNNKLPEEMNQEWTRESHTNQSLISSIEGKEKEGGGGKGGGVEELKEILEELLHLLSTPTYTCRKLIAMGGFTCNHKADGEKYVCHDPGVFRQGEYCLVYSLGAGHDFSFDGSIARHGCEVFTFDGDSDHMKYPTQIGRGMWFYKVRIGPDFLKQLLHYVSPSSSSSSPQLLTYWPLPAVMSRLGHHNNHLHYLKIDIEGHEWKVLEESLFKTSILEHTQQLGLEVHLDELKTGNKTLIARKYLRVLRGLDQRGFRLAHWEPNFRGSEVITIAGLTFHLFSETLWVNTKFKPKRNLPNKVDPPPFL
ncbi:uncharacterized protein LOC126981742 isoform X2 [Eriocheir sinensis]|nr:uncharacterized protein LOC126981742 isoform X2 [Eriocheir sinensis]